MGNIPFDFLPHPKIGDWGSQCKEQMTDLQFQMACGQALQDGLKALAVDIVSEAIKQLRPPTPETIVGLPDAARILNMKPATLRKMVSQGRISYIRDTDGKNLKFKVTDLNQYINEHYVQKIQL